MSKQLRSTVLRAQNLILTDKSFGVIYCHSTADVIPAGYLLLRFYLERTVLATYLWMATVLPHNIRAGFYWVRPQVHLARYCLSQNGRMWTLSRSVNRA